MAGGSSLPLGQAAVLGVVIYRSKDKIRVDGDAA